MGGVETTHITDMEEQTLQVRELGESEGQEVEVGIESGTSCCLIFLEGIGGNQREGGASIRGSEMQMYGGVDRLIHTRVDESSGGK